MAEYIDREIAAEIIDNYAKTISKDCLVVYQAIRDIVDTICPAVEAKPVVHAHWVTDFDFDPEEEQERYFYFCSKCKNVLFGNKEDFKYCPYCGAQMDEVTLNE